MEFVWDDFKNVANAEKHRVWFEEAQTIFDDPLARLFRDSENSTECEDRWLILGMSAEAKLLLVVFVDVNEEGRRIRIISARKATKYEARNY